MDLHTTAIADGRELIAFRVEDQDFCVDIRGVREIRGWSPATPLPHAPGYVRGVINLRGSVLPIVDLSARLGFGAVEPSARHVIIVAEIGSQLVGLLVDAVSDILTVSREVIQPTPDVASEVARTFIAGVIPVDGRMLSLVSLDAILPRMTEELAA